MDNKLSELSKPSAEIVSKFGDPEAFGERELKVLADIQKLAYGTKFYSQEYVSALLSQIEADREIKARLCCESNSLHDGLKAAEKRIAELEASVTSCRIAFLFCLITSRMCLTMKVGAGSVLRSGTP